MEIEAIYEKGVLLTFDNPVDRLPKETEDVISESSSARRRELNETFKFIKERRNDTKHYYFYWMTGEPLDIYDFEKEYTDAYNLKYAGILKALKKFSREISSLE